MSTMNGKTPQQLAKEIMSDLPTEAARKSPDWKKIMENCKSF